MWGNPFSLLTCDLLLITLSSYPLLVSRVTASVCNSLVSPLSSAGTRNVRISCQLRKVAPLRMNRFLKTREGQDMFWRFVGREFSSYEGYTCVPTQLTGVFLLKDDRVNNTRMSLRFFTLALTQWFPVLQQMVGTKCRLRSLTKMQNKLFFQWMSLLQLTYICCVTFTKILIEYIYILRKEWR